MNPALPIINTPTTISFSSLSNHDYCPHYYLLVDILRLKPWKNSPDTIFGTYIHKAVQDVLSDVITEEVAVKQFERKWKVFSKIYKKFLKKEHIDMGLSARAIIEKVKPVLTSTFGKFSVLAIEERLSLPSGDKWPQKFKGFIDIVLKLEDGKIILVDFKTSDSAFFFEKFKETIKDYQLTLYKYFYSIKHNCSQDIIETYFIILEKNIKSKSSVVPLRITSGPKKVQNALKWLEFRLSAINRKVFVKNRLSCKKFGDGHPCAFYKTKECP